MKLSQLALLELLTADDTTRLYAESDGHGDSLKLGLVGEIKFSHRDLREMVERGLVGVSDLGLVTATRAARAGGAVLAESPPDPRDVQITAAQRAVAHLLKRIREDERVRYHFRGTQSFELLAEAAAALFGEPVERVREHFGGSI